MATTGLSCILSEIAGNFSQKLQIFPTPVYIAPQPIERIPLEFSIGAGGQKTRIMGLPGRERCLTIFSRLDTMQERDGQTDSGCQQRPRYNAVSRGKNNVKLLHTHHYTQLWYHSKANTAEQIVLN